jgi:hypothetical protein
MVIIGSTIIKQVFFYVNWYKASHVVDDAWLQCFMKTLTHNR